LRKPKEYLAFEKLARGLLAVPREEINEQAALHDEKKRRTRAKPGKKAKPSPSTSRSGD
jgi:hypothetical protein